VNTKQVIILGAAGLGLAYWFTKFSVLGHPDDIVNGNVSVDGGIDVLLDILPEPGDIRRWYRYATLLAVPLAGKKFSHWSLGDATTIYATTTTIEVTVTTNMIFTAHFVAV
jgi:hypothetical protein